MAWSVVRLLPHTHDEGTPSSGKPYLRHTASRKSDLLRTVPHWGDGSVVNHEETPFSPAMSNKRCCVPDTLLRIDLTVSHTAACRSFRSFLVTSLLADTAFRIDGALVALAPHCVARVEETSWFSWTESGTMRSTRGGLLLQLLEKQLYWHCTEVTHTQTLKHKEIHKEVNKRKEEEKPEEVEVGGERDWKQKLRTETTKERERERERERENERKMRGKKKKKPDWIYNTSERNM